jgi:hypothetical protein
MYRNKGLFRKQIFRDTPDTDLAGYLAARYPAKPKAGYRKEIRYQESFLL